MEVTGMHRRLAAILTAEVAGQAGQAGDGDAGTPERMERLYRDMIAPAIAAHEGHVLKHGETGFSADFITVREAVKCALSIQRGLRDRQETEGAEPPLRLRIGVNLGEVLAEGGEISGSGVDIAESLAGRAGPGGICINRTMLGQVKYLGDVHFEDAGKLAVDASSDPVQVYRLLLDPPPVHYEPPVVVERRGPRRWPVLALGAATLAFALSAGLWLFARGPSFEPVEPERMAFALPDKPSLAVLPFGNLSEEPSHRPIAAGLTGDLIFDLSKIADLFVIARHSSFAYRDRDVPIHEVAEELGVRYVVTGSIGRDGDALQINVRLVDTAEGEEIWAERFDGRAGDIFALRDTIAQRIAETLAVDLSPRSAQLIVRGQTDRIAAWEAFHKGWGLYLKFNAEDNEAAIVYLERAIERDALFGLAYAALSLAYYRSAEWAWARQDTMSFMDSWALGQYFLDQALHEPTSLAHIAAATDYLWRGDSDAAFNEALHAMLLDRNDPEAHLVLAWAMITSGRPQDGMESIANAQRLNPVYPARYDLAHAMAHFAMGDFAAAAEVLTAAAARDPGAVELAPPLAASYAYLGRREDARAALSAWKSGASQSELQGFVDIYHFPIQWAGDGNRVRDRLLDGLRIAALPLDEDVAKLLADLDDDSVLVRKAATEKLGWFRDQAREAVPQLIPALNDENDSLRRETMLTLGKIGPAAEAAIPALEAAQQEIGLESFAEDALRKIRGE